jgi:nucleoside 2-deoxyribosyltransferase
MYTSAEQGRPSQLPEISAWTESEHADDTGGLLELLIAANLMERPAPGSIRLTPAGFVRLEASEHASPATRQAFVAMWFGAEMDDAYIHGFAPAIEQAGFSPLRIDRKEHSNKIDDEIIMEIRRSRFVVADFTCPVVTQETGEIRPDSRGGVYYEAGFAQGLNIPVIWTVRADLIGMVHFDTRQFAHITWATPQELRERLRTRIGAVINGKA